MIDQALVRSCVYCASGDAPEGRYYGFVHQVRGGGLLPSVTEVRCADQAWWDHVVRDAQRRREADPVYRAGQVLDALCRERAMRARLW